MLRVAGPTSAIARRTGRTAPRAVLSVLPERGAEVDGRAAHATWRRAAIAAIKLVHSAIFLVNAASILHILWAGLSGRRSRWTGPALAAALTESAVFVLNHGRCPLTGLVEDLGAASGGVSDIFLPRWLADRIPLLFFPPLAAGLLALLLRG
jgi:hypothetical protein